ncbi:TylF/MycF/NovP-related O-methyltransferase [Micromonospora sp. LOL_024]|uniref:TylF/MycF/NovP-related O-methyltransferase n=1 Tax=Micromonospora sp. LOL_024 TaxID=3345412 RepID=UPI003A8BA0C6
MRGSHSYHGPRELSKVLAVYDLYKDILAVPGHIVEIGVYRGFKAMLFGHLIRLFGGEIFRRYYGFDTFTGFPPPQSLDGEECMAGEAWRHHRTSVEQVTSLAATAG